jgi:hypothetical protein
MLEGAPQVVKDVTGKLHCLSFVKDDAGDVGAEAIDCVNLLLVDGGMDVG